MKTISIISTKGGVGKTTFAANLSGHLSMQGKKVLMIDADPQPSLSSYYLITHQSNGGLTETVADPTTINENISRTAYGDLIYSNDADNQLQTWLASKSDGRFRLKFALQHLEAKYDYVIIDTQGAKGNLQDAAVLAADVLLTPIPPESASIKEFERGTLSLLDELQTYKNIGVNVPSLFGVFYKVERTNDSKHFISYVLQNEDERCQMLKTRIPQSVVFKEAVSQCVPVSEFANGNKKQENKAQNSINTIKSLVDELVLLTA